jgi:hypothetical protein
MNFGSNDDSSAPIADMSVPVLKDQDSWLTKQEKESSYPKMMY